jgi:hypothetical protein
VLLGKTKVEPVVVGITEDGKEQDDVDLKGG